MARRPSALLTERLARHGLADAVERSVAEAAGLTGAIQAQDAPASRLGLRVRAAGVSEADVVRAIAEERSVARTWLMRGTIHLVDSADLRWLTRLIGPSIERRYRTRWRQIGLRDELLERTADTMPQLLAGGPLTRREIAAGLAEQGVRVDSPDPQAMTHTVVHASTVGLICRGPDRGRDATFVLVDDWLPDAPEGPSGDDALAELARRYFAAFSPATAADFGTWSGLASGRAVELIRDELTPADVDGRPGYRLGGVEAARGLRLLPAFDNYLLGYRDREAILAADRQPLVYQGGMIRPTVLHDGRVVGSWSLRRPPASAAPDRPATVTVQPFERLTRVAVRAVDDEVADLARFLDRPVEAMLDEPG